MQRIAKSPSFTRPFAALACLSLVASGCVRVEEDEPAEEERAESQANPETKAAEPALTPAQATLKTEIREIGGTFEGEVGIAVQEVESGWTATFDGSELFPQQSVSKLWVALALLERVDEGKLSLSDKVTISEPDLTVFHQPIRALVLQKGSYTTDLADLLERALTQSDNTANDVLLNKVGGPDAVRAILARKGLKGIRFGPGERELQSATAGMIWDPAFSFGQAFWEARDQIPQEERERAFNAYLADPMDGAQPQAIADALARLERGELLSASSTERILAILEKTHSGPNRLKGGVPSGWSIRHKTGTGQNFAAWQAGYNDVGIVTSPEGHDYAVAVLIRKTDRPIPQRMDMMHKVVRAIVSYEEERGVKSRT